MKRVFLTGEKGFIARNLIKKAEGRLEFIKNDYLLPVTAIKRELDFVDTPVNTIKHLLKKQECDIIIHNGAIVGTDVCALNPRRAIETNVYGTYNIALAAKHLNIPIIYIGTTVIYDTQKVQDDWIIETSPIFPRTLYASTKYEGELIIKANCEKSKYCILRPLFCYGGEGDMNSLIAKSIYNHYKRKKSFKIFLDPSKIKDYMHVDDFCESIIFTAENDHILKLNTDFNISADNPIETTEIEKEIRNLGIDTSHIKWIPKTDYLGNHRVDNRKFKWMTRYEWNPKIDLKTGIERSKKEILDSVIEYNPFLYLDRIEQEKIDIESYYNFGA